MKRKQAINLQIFAVSEANIVIVVQAVELKLFIWQPVTTSNSVPCLLAANSSDHTMVKLRLVIRKTSVSCISLTFLLIDNVSL